MMAANRAAELGKRVLLLEKNKKLGEKLRISGGGRCNITNAEENLRFLLAHYGKAEKFLYSSFVQFGVQETFAFFSDRGLPLVVQAGKRAFPETEKAADVCRVFGTDLQRNKVDNRTGIVVHGIFGENGVIKKVVAGGETFTADSYILATGGKSHPETGSTGDGFRWLKQLGHTVKEPTPTIVPLAVREGWVKTLAGTALDNVKISFLVNGKSKFSLRGRILCTHFGLSGPLVLNAAERVHDLLQEGAVTANIDLFPKLDLGGLDAYVRDVFDAQKNKILHNVLRGILPAGTARAILPLIKHVDLETKVHSVTKEQRRALAHFLKNLPLTIAGLMGLDRAVVVDGGVDYREIDAKTMRSRLYKNLHITGDLLHISRPSGGYSLQLCWTTGFVAGCHA